MADVAFGLSPQPFFLVRGDGGRLQLRLQPLNNISGVRGFGPSFDYSSHFSVGLGYLRDRFSKGFHLDAGAVSSDSKASNISTFDEKQPELDNSGGSGNGFGDRRGGGGGGGGGGDNNGGRGDSNKGEEGSDVDRRKMALSMSQKLTLGYAALVGVGGVMGFLKSGSQKSLLAGGLSASLLYYVYSELPVRPVFASSLGLGISAALLGVMGSRFKRSGKIFPAGVVSLVSLVMTGGFLHGIMRSAH
ncbi:protein FATTY ACID EXPORT 2, chloroplastic [Quillaja saponaria]|uniref:Protein FATTY ACID EXPORT 2, chloroplastic n=1 Tax=Quillaja saponaria TaxID=32244 RepID=A0AAD7VM49_QUISA|nr:protein FATTY ACID EXPORT 2, chloroplastic [Quillaja saponaria]